MRSRRLRTRRFAGGICTVLVASTLVVIGVAAPPASAGPVGTVTNFSTTNIIRPSGITTGPDGNVWFTNFGSDAVGRVTPTGALAEFRNAVNAPQGITTGPDGALWVVGNREIGRITTDGEVTNFPSSSLCCSANIVTGPDGALWFTTTPQSVARMTTAGEISTFFTFRDTQGITVGPDGALWFTAYTGHDAAIGRITTNGVITTFTDPQLSFPGNITTGSDGNLWFTQNGSIGRITPAGVVTTFGDPDVNGFEEITVGPDGALWFARGTNSIGRITVAGVISSFANAAISAPRGITSGPGGALWFTNSGSNSIGRVTTAGTVLTPFTGDGIGNPDSIAAGANGDLWFTDPGTGLIGRMTPSGNRTFHSVPARTVTSPIIGTATVSANPAGIVSGPNGSLHFVQHGTNVPVGQGASVRVYAGVGAISANGTITPDTSDGPAPLAIAIAANGGRWWTHGFDCILPFECVSEAIVGPTATYAAPPIDNPSDIAAGPDGNMWFLDVSGEVERIGRITPGGVVTMFTHAGFHGVAHLSPGGDGNVWFTTANNSIGRITPGGVVTLFTDPSISAPGGLALGPDDNIWFTNTANDSIGRITPAGVVTNYTSATISEPTAISAGRDGGVWFINSGNDSFGRVQALLPNAATMAYPANGAFVGNATFLVAAGGPGVTAIEFHVTGGTLHDTPVATAVNFGPYGWWGAWGTTAVPAGSYQIVAVGTDAAGNRGRSSPHTITIDHTPPNTVIADPAANAVLRGTVPLIAGATDNHGVTKVEYLRNGVVIATAARTWFGWLGIWDTTTVANGTYNLRSKAYDAAGNTNQSNPVPIRIQN